MKRIVLAIAAGLLLLSSCEFRINGSERKVFSSESVSNGDVLTRTENVGSFTKFVCSIPCEVEYESGESKIIIVSPERLMDHIKVIQDGETVTIKSDSRKIRGYADTKIYVTSRFLESLVVNGAVEFNSKGGIKSREDFEMTINGAGDCNINGLKADDINITCNGAADMTLSEISARALNLKINGAGDATLSGRVRDASFVINGAGDITATALQADRISPVIHGVGSINCAN